MKRSICIQLKNGPSTLSPSVKNMFYSQSLGICVNIDTVGVTSSWDIVWDQ